MDTTMILGAAVDGMIHRGATLAATVAIASAILLSVAWMLAGVSCRRREL